MQRSSDEDVSTISTTSGYGNRYTCIPNVKFTYTASASAPTVTTTAVTTYGSTSATMGGNVTNAGSSTVTERGVVYSSSNSTPTIDGNGCTKQAIGSGTGAFSRSITGLTASTTYYVRAYAKNTAGTSYGSTRSFSTSSPHITIGSHTGGLLSTSPSGSAIPGETVTVTATPNSGYQLTALTYNDGSDHSISISSLPYTFTMPSADVTVTAMFSKITYTITCSPSSGSSYISYSGTAQIGNTITVTAHPATGYQLSSITATNASTSASITLSGSGNTRTFTMPAGNVSVTATFSKITYTITCSPSSGSSYISYTGTPQMGETITVTAHPATGYQLSSITATNTSASTSISLSGSGNTRTFTMPAANVTVTATFSTKPTVTTGNVGTPTTSSVSITANNVSSDGGASVTARGVYCGTSANPTSGGGASGSGTGNYDVSLSDLTSNTLYYVRAYATNTVGTGYGSDKTFTTLAVVSTPTSASVTSSSATFSSSVTAGGNATITERGVYWSTSSTAPTSSTTLNSSNSKAASTAATGSYSVTPTSFTTGTTYYVWAYVRNAGGINFSSSYSTITTLTRHTVTYDKNHSGASGTMTDSNSPYDAGSTVTVLANSFTAPTNYIFGIWNTAADGSGTSYTAGSTFTITANTTLYAQWAPIRIANATQWYEFSAVVNDGFTYSGQTVYLDADITVTTSAPVGTSSKPFQGTFDGNGHVVNYTHSANVDHKGLFGYVSGSGNIKNVIVNATLSGNSTSVGAVVGTFASSGTISNVGASGTISSSATNVGGLVGEMTDGTIHSSYAVAALTGSATNKGGLVGQNAGTLYNSYSNATYSGTATTGGLVGANSGTVANCYVAGVDDGVYAFAGSNSSTIQYCYADATGDGYCGSGSASGHGTYEAIPSPESFSLKDKDYMYRDNYITLASGSSTTYVPQSGATTTYSYYDDHHTIKWNGLVSALNQWVTANKTSGANISTLSSWYRPLTTNINGDLPVLGFGDHTTLGAASGSPKVLKYGTMDDLLTTYSGGTASIFHYGKATGVTHVPTANVKVYIAEDAVLMQTTTSPSDFKATVGVTFDNSDRGAHAYDYWGNKLNYDWHLLSTPLSDLKTGAVHSSSYTEGGLPDSQVDITDIDGYFPDGLITNDNPAVGGTIKWDFYTYYEPEYHWINLKRSRKNHIHQDGGAPIHYDQGDQDSGDNTAQYIPGKGYEMAISQDTYMNATGTLNRGDVPITLTNSEPDDINYAKGWNLVGNPYQAYLDIDELSVGTIYTYDADQGTFVPYHKSASSNPEIVSQYIHPHQAFFVQASSNNEVLRFTQSMATTDTQSGSYFRDDKVNYPLVNLFAEDGAGHRDLTVIEFHRPELGGAPKLDYMRTSPFSLAAYYSGRSYGILFATDDIERVPVHFKPGNGGLITLTWITHNGEFSMLNLIDNKLGVEHDMLADNTYVFEASPDDYSSRFYITYECSGTGIDENDDDGASTGSATFAYINNGNIVIDVGSGHGASLQMIDVLGRVMYSTVCTDDVHTVSTNGLAKGVYLIRLVNNKVVRTQKIVVK